MTQINKVIKVLTCLTITSCISVAGEINSLAPGLKKQGWEEIVFDDKKPNTFSSCGQGCIEISTEMSVSMIGRTIDIDLSATPYLNWEWRVEKPLKVSDLTAKGKDDRVVALYVTFPYDSKYASFTEKLLRPMVELKRGRNAPGRVISYVWAGYGAPNQVIDSPFFGSAGAIIILRNLADKTGEWLSESVDVTSDYQRIFGMLPTRANYILIAGDGDDTKTRNQALVRGIRFSIRKN